MAPDTYSFFSRGSLILSALFKNFSTNIWKKKSIKLYSAECYVEWCLTFSLFKFLPWLIIQKYILFDVSQIFVKNLIKISSVNEMNNGDQHLPYLIFSRG